MKQPSFVYSGVKVFQLQIVRDEHTVRHCSKLVESLIAAVQAECEKCKTRADTFNSQPESMNLRAMRRDVKGDCYQNSTGETDQVSCIFETTWKGAEV